MEREKDEAIGGERKMKQYEERERYRRRREGRRREGRRRVGRRRKEKETSC